MLDELRFYRRATALLPLLHRNMVAAGKRDAAGDTTPPAGWVEAGCSICGNEKRCGECVKPLWHPVGRPGLRVEPLPGGECRITLTLPLGAHGAAGALDALLTLAPDAPSGA